MSMKYAEQEYNAYDTLKYKIYETEKLLKGLKEIEQLIDWENLTKEQHFALWTYLIK